MFISSLLLLMLLISSLLLGGLRSINNGYWGMLNDVMNGRINSDIIVSGSSRAMVHFDCALVSSHTCLSCYNLGLNGTGLAMQYALLKTYLKHNKKPLVLVQVIDIDSFSDNAYRFETMMYTPHLKEEEIYRTIYESDSSIWRNRYLPLYSFAQYGVSLMGPAFRGVLKNYNDPEEVRYRGYHPQYRSWNSDFDNFVKNNPGGITYKIKPEAVQKLENIVQLSRARGIEIVLVFAPEYYRVSELTRNKKDIMNVVTGIAGRYKIPFYDYSGSRLTKSTDYFYNSQHLNSRGAAIFSVDFSEKLRRHLKNNISEVIYAKK